MVRAATTQNAIIGLLADGVPRGTAEISREVGLSDKAVQLGCYRAWRGGKLLRSERQLFGRLTRFRGRAGSVSNQRGFYKYTLCPEGFDELVVDGFRFVPYGEDYLSSKFPKGQSKAQKIVAFLRDNKDRAFYSVDVYEALKGEGVKQSDVMGSARARKEELYPLFAVQCIVKCFLLVFNARAHVSLYYSINE